MMAETSLAPGFRFHPTDAELVCFYLKGKIVGKVLPSKVIAEIDLYKFAPWDLPDKSCLKSKDLEWYFFCPRDRKYATGSRTKRATDFGYWKTTGRDKTIANKSHTVGMRKTLVFHEGKAPGGSRTDWIIYEYRLEDKDLTDTGIPQDKLVLCKLFQKSGRGPKNGEHHGAPFNEEEWEDDGTGIDGSGSVSCMFSAQDLHDEEATMLEPGPSVPAVSETGEVQAVSGTGEAHAVFGTGEVSSLPDGEEELWTELIEVLRYSPDNLGNILGEASSSHVLPCQTIAADTYLGEIFDGLCDLPLQAEPKETNNGTNTVNNEYALQLEDSVQELHVNLEEFLMDIDPSVLDIHDPFQNLPSFHDMNATGVSASAVDDTAPPAAAIIDSFHGPNTYRNEYTPNVEINAFGDDDNQQIEALLHELMDPVWQTEYGAHVCSTPGAGASDSKKSFSYSDPSCSNCYPYRYRSLPYSKQVQMFVLKNDQEQDQVRIQTNPNIALPTVNPVSTKASPTFPPFYACYCSSIHIPSSRATKKPERERESKRTGNIIISSPSLCVSRCCE
ncbi:putative transcription factor NAM family [Dioscorea sansibarensis]